MLVEVKFSEFRFKTLTNGQKSHTKGKNEEKAADLFGTNILKYPDVKSAVYETSLSNKIQRPSLTANG